MTTVERTLAALIVLAGLVVLGWLGVMNYGSARYAAGFADAVAAGQEKYNFEVKLARTTEDDLRGQLRAKDDIASIKEKKHAQDLASAQRRILLGVDSLRCPSRAVSIDTAGEYRPATGGPSPDAGGQGLVPAASADLLGLAGDIAGLVRRYERLEERFDACQALNAAH